MRYIAWGTLTRANFTSDRHAHFDLQCLCQLFPKAMRKSDVSSESDRLKIIRTGHHIIGEGDATVIEGTREGAAIVPNRQKNKTTHPTKKPPPPHPPPPPPANPNKLSFGIPADWEL